MECIRNLLKKFKSDTYKPMGPEAIKATERMMSLANVFALQDADFKKRLKVFSRLWIDAGINIQRGINNEIQPIQTKKSQDQAD